MATNHSLTHHIPDEQFSLTDNRIMLYPITMVYPDVYSYSKILKPKLVSSVWLSCAVCRLINVDGVLTPAYSFGHWYVL